MKAFVYVRYKNEVKSPENAALLQSLSEYSFVKEADKQECFEINLDAGNISKAYKAIRDMCEQLLANPVIEEFRFDLENYSHDKTRSRRQGPWFYFDGRKWKKRQP